MQFSLLLRLFLTNLVLIHSYTTTKQINLLKNRLQSINTHTTTNLSYKSFKLNSSYTNSEKLYQRSDSNENNNNNSLPSRRNEPKLNIQSYLWPKGEIKLKFFLILSMIFMILGKIFIIKVPFLLQNAIDTLATAYNMNNISIMYSKISISFLLYGLSRTLSCICAEIKTCLFAHVSFTALRKFANQIFQHLHELDAQFHLKTPSGVMSVAYVRAIRGFQALMFQIVFSVMPTILELGMVCTILYNKCGRIFTGVTLLTFSMYLLFTIAVTQWRIKLRQELVDVDNARNGFFIGKRVV